MKSPRYCFLAAGTLVASIVCGRALALEPVSYGERVLGPQKHAGTVEALGPDMFGEEINTYTGGISFSQTDLSLPGNDKLPVTVTRRLVVDGNKSPANPVDDNLWRGYNFGEWELDLPYLSGTYSEAQGWVVSTATPNARCSSPTTRAQFEPRNVNVGNVNFYNFSFWSGINLNVPGQREQKLLIRPVGGPVPVPAGSWTALTTKSNWHFSCLPTLQSGQPGEGFMALGPDGTRYFFDWMVAYAERDLHGRNKIYSGMWGEDRWTWVSADLVRKTYRLYPTRIEDRFGNSVTYAWSGSNLNTISSSDGRVIAFTYSGGQIASATDGTRTVQYAYSDGLLSTVTFPDASSWSFSSAAMLALKRYAPFSDPDPWDFPMTCQRMRRLGGGEADFQMTHPSGAVGKFRMTFKRHFRTNVIGSTGSCPALNVGDADPPLTPADDKPLQPTRYDVLALNKKLLSGPGMPEQSWAFAHQDTYSMGPGYPALGTRTVTATQPDGSMVIDTYGTDALANESQLLSSEVRESSTVLSRTENAYVQTPEMSGVPFPDWMGEPLLYETDRGRGDYNRPLRTSLIKQQGASFKTQVNTFDALVRPLSVSRWSELVTPGAVSYKTTQDTQYDDNLNEWVLGQVKKVVACPTLAGCTPAPSAAGVVVSETNYDPVTALPLWKKSFAKLQQTLTYDLTTVGQKGTLKTIKDGNNNLVTLSDWKRGIPQKIKYPVTPESPAGAEQSAWVSNPGWIEWVKDENGYKTCYGYDLMGRTSEITHTSEATAGVCDTSTWNKTTLAFERIAS
ncbi:MAG TPA: hypothetical protein VIT22_02340, partial [Pseudoxanthomonas sp.]